MLINAFFAIYTSKAETTFSSKKTFASSSSAWNAHRFLKMVWHGRVFRVDTFAFRYIQNEIVISNDWICLYFIIKNILLSKRKDANLWGSQIWRFFFGPAFPPPHPDRVRRYDPYPLPHWAISRENSIYQGLQVVEYSSNQTLAYIGVTKKKLSSICLQRTTSITQENEARNRNTSKRSQMILEFWNIWSLNLSFLWANDPNFLLSGGFWSPVWESGRLPLYSGDSMIIRESWRIWKRS